MKNITCLQCFFAVELKGNKLIDGQEVKDRMLHTSVKILQIKKNFRMLKALPLKSSGLHFSVFSDRSQRGALYFLIFLTNLGSIRVELVG